MQPSRRRLLALGAALPALAAASPGARASTVTAAAARSTRILHFVPVAGPMQDAARDFFAGAKLHFDDLNRRGAAGGVGGRRIAQSQVPLPADPAAQWREIAEVIARERPAVIFGLPGDALLDRALAELPAWFQQAAIVSPLSGLPLGADARAGNVITTRASYVEEAGALLRHFSGLGATRILMLLPASAPASLREALQRALRDAGLVAARVQAYGDTASDLGAQLDAAVRNQLQVVVMVSDTIDLIEAERRLRRHSARPQLAGMSTVNHRFVVEALGAAAAQGIVLTQVMPNPARGTLALTREHARLLEQMFDEPPSHMTLEGYFAARVLADAMAGARDPGVPALLAALRNGRMREIGGLAVDLQRSAGRFVDLAVIAAGGRLAG